MAKKSGYRDKGASSQLDYLEEMILLHYGEHGRILIDDVDDGFQEIEIDDTVKTLASGSGIPSEASSATIMVERGSGVSDSKKDRCVRFTENDTPPTASMGWFLGDGDLYEVSGDALATISFISGEAGQTSKIFVQFHEAIETDS